MNLYCSYLTFFYFCFFLAPLIPMAPNLFLPEGRTQHGIKFCGPEHGSFANIKNEIMQRCTKM